MNTHDEELADLLRKMQAAVARPLGLTDDGELFAGPTFDFHLPVVGYSIALPDVTLDIDLIWRTIEVNVSNAAGSSAHGGDVPRVEHEVETILGRQLALRPGSVILRPYSPDTRSWPEINLRSAALAWELQRRTGGSVTVRAPDESVDPKSCAVIVGPIPEMVSRLGIASDGTPTFDGAPVIMAMNPNIWAAYARLHSMTLGDVFDSIDPLRLHEGGAMARVGGDKNIQQDLMAGTGIEPIAYRRCDTRDEVAACAVEYAHAFGGAVIKPCGGISGGSHVLVVDPKMSYDDVMTALAEADAPMVKKYGPQWSAVSPLSVYRFVEAAPAEWDDGGHRWDLRFLVLARPGRVSVTPLSARLAPMPIGDVLDRASGVVNQTDRAKGETKAVDPAELCARVGVSSDALAVPAEALARVMLEVECTTDSAL